MTEETSIHPSIPPKHQRQITEDVEDTLDADQFSRTTREQHLLSGDEPIPLDPDQAVTSSHHGDDELLSPQDASPIHGNIGDLAVSGEGLDALIPAAPVEPVTDDEVQ